MKHFYACLRSLLCILFLTLAAGPAGAAEKTITLTADGFGLTNSYATKTATFDGYEFVVDKGYLGTSQTIQMNNKNNGKPGKLYNTTPIKGLKKVTVTKTTGTYALYTSSQAGATTSAVSGTAAGANTSDFVIADGSEFFTIQVTGVNNFTSIVITYDDEEGGSVDPDPEIAGTGEGTLESPYDVERALSLIENNMNTAANVYVAGTISAIKEISLSYGNATYDIVGASADAVLNVYHGLFLENEKFTSENQIKVGDEVIVCGRLSKYGTTSQFAAGNYIYSLNGNTKSKADAGLSFPQAAYTVNAGETFEAPVLSNPNGLGVTYASSNEAVATVDAEGAVTLTGGTGTTEISAVSAETDAFRAGQASYTITVVEPFDASGYKALVAEYDGSYYIAVNKTSGSNKYLTCDPVDYVINGKVVNVADKDKYSWEIEVDGTTAKVRNTEGMYLSLGTGNTNATLESASKVLTVEDGVFYASNGKTRFLGYNSNNGSPRFASYAVSNMTNKQFAVPAVMDFADGHVRTGLAEGKTGTVCLPRAVAAGDVRGARFYEIAGKTSTALVLSEVCGGLEAGVPYIFIAESGEIVAAYTGTEDVAAPGARGGLYGAFEKTTVPEGAYVLNGGLLRQSNGASTVAANRAYVRLDEVSEYGSAQPAANCLLLGFDGTVTAVGGVQTAATAAPAAYDLGGRRVVKPVAGGLYIVDGKKVIVK